MTRLNDIKAEATCLGEHMWASVLGKARWTTQHWQLGAVAGDQIVLYAS